MKTVTVGQAENGYIVNLLEHVSLGEREKARTVLASTWSEVERLMRDHMVTVPDVFKDSQ